MIAFPNSAIPTAPGAYLERLGDEVAALASHVDSATYRLLVRLREYDARDGWGGGFASCAHWLSWRTGIAPGAAREKVRVARALADLPFMSAAMERGELSFSKVRAITRIATPQTEVELLELARHEARHLTVHADDDGSYVLRGRLDPEVGALLERALDAAACRRHRAPCGVRVEGPRAHGDAFRRPTDPLGR